MNVFPRQIEELPLKIAGLAPHYQLEVTCGAHRDELLVQVECLTEVAADPSLRARLQQQLQTSIKAMIGIATQVQARDPGAIERSAGKARRVIDRRPRN